MTLHWTAAQDSYIMLHSDMGANWIALQLNRTPHAINQRASKLRKQHKIKIKSRIKPFRQKPVIYPRKPTWRFMRNLTLIRDNYTCVYCGKSADTVDHVTARSKGGSDALHNLVAACRRCNTLRGTSCVHCPEWQRNGN